MNKLTVIVPHFNDLKNLERLLSTIPQKNVSVIVIDNTPDLSLKDFESLQNKNPSVHFYKSLNNGAGLARNIGIAKAATDWVIFADADDVFTPSFFRIVENYFESDSEIVYFSPGFVSDVAFSKDYRMHYAKMVDKYLSNPIKENEWEIRLTFDVPWSKMIKRQFIIDKQLVFENTKKQNDTMFSQKAGIFANKVSISNETIYCAVDNRQSITHQMSKPYFEDALNVKIRSYHLKMNLVDKNFLKKCNYLIYIEPLMTTIKALKIYKEFNYGYKVYQTFKKNEIPVFSITVVHICFNKLMKRIFFSNFFVSGKKYNKEERNEIEIMVSKQDVY